MRTRVVVLLLTVFAVAGVRAAEPEILNDSFTPHKGYKAFYEAGYSFALAEDEPEFTLFPLDGICDKFSAVTSHGYQFSRLFYLGAGTGFEYYTHKELREVSIPLFVNARLNFLKKRYSPFLDFKLGGAFGEVMNGVYINMQLGLRIGIPHNHAVFLAAEFFMLADIQDTNRNNVENTITPIGFKLGYEF